MAKESKQPTVEQLIKNGLVKVGATIEFKSGEYKGRKGEVKGIKESEVTISITGADSLGGKEVKIDGARFVHIGKEGSDVITIEPHIAPEPVEVSATPLGTEPVVEPGNTGLGMPAVTGKEDEVPESKSEIKEEDEPLVDHSRFREGNVLQDKEGDNWIVRSASSVGLTIGGMKGYGKVGVTKFIEWDEFEGMGLKKIAEAEKLSKEENSVYTGVIESKKVNETKAKISVSSTVKEVIDLKIKEASIRAERDKAFEIVGQLTGIEKKLQQLKKSSQLEAKILVKKLKEANGTSSEVKALRKKLEEKAELAGKIEEELGNIKESLSLDLNSLKESVGKKDSELVSLKEKRELELNEARESGKKEGISQVIKEYVECKLADVGFSVGENTRALLEECNSLEDVDDVLEQVRDVKRRSALHSETIEGIAVSQKPVDPEQDKINKDVGSAFEGMGGS